VLTDAAVAQLFSRRHLRRRDRLGAWVCASLRSCWRSFVSKVCMYRRYPLIGTYVLIQGSMAYLCDRSSGVCIEGLMPISNHAHTLEQ
jgi:hypothetical protein